MLLRAKHEVSTELQMKKEFPGSLTKMHKSLSTASSVPVPCLCTPLAAGCPHIKSSPRSWGEWDSGVCREAACNIPEFVNILRPFQAMEALVLISPDPAFPACCLH